MSTETATFAASIAGALVLVPVSATIEDPATPPPDPPLDTTPPAAPTLLFAVGNDDGIALNWANNTEPDLAGYYVHRVLDGDDDLLNRAGLVSTSSFFDGTALADVTYTYYVTAVDDSGNESAHSNNATGTRTAPPPANDPPDPVTGLTATPSFPQIALDWNDNPEPDIANYRVYRASMLDGPYTLIASPVASAFNDLTATQGAITYYRVTAVDTIGQESTPVGVAATRPIPPMGTSILISSQATMSPATVHVYATNYGGMRYFTQPERPGLALANGTPLTTRYRWSFLDANGIHADGAHAVLEGFNAAHVFENNSIIPRDFTIKLEITQANGAKLNGQATITVVPDARTAIYVDAQGYVVGTPDGGAGSLGSPCKTLAKAMTLLTRADMKILLARCTAGSYYGLGSTINLTKKNTLIDAYTPAGRMSVQPFPEIQWTGAHSSASCMIQAQAENCTVRNLQFYVQNPTFNVTSNTKIFSTANGAKNFTISGCTIRESVPGGAAGVGSFFEQDTSPIIPPDGVLILDNHLPKRSCSIYGIGYLAGANYVIVGNSNDEFGQHGVRVAGADNVLVALNDLRRPKPAEDSLPNRPIFSPHVGRYMYFTQNTCAGGDLTMGPLAIGGQTLINKADRCRFIVFDRNTSTSIPTSSSGHFCGFNILHGCDNIMLRNNAVDHNDWVSLAIDGFNDEYQRGVSEVFIYNNTFRNNGPTGTGVQIGGTARVSLRNNLYLAERLTTQGQALKSYASIANSFGNTADPGRAAVDRNIWPPTLISGQSNTPNIFTVQAFSKIDLTAWNAAAQVGTDGAEFASLQSQVDGVNWKPASPLAPSFGRPIPGVWEDLYGAARSSSASSWAAGCAEP